MPRSRPAPGSGGGSGRLGAADPTPATQTTAGLPSTAPLSRGLTPRVSPLAGVGRVDCCCCLSLHFPGSTGSGTICFTHTVFKTPSSPIPDPSSFIWQRASLAQAIGSPGGGNPCGGDPGGGDPGGGNPGTGRQGEVFLYKKHIFLFCFVFFSLSLSLSLYIYIYICQPWRGQPWRGPGGGDY